MAGGGGAGGGPYSSAPDPSLAVVALHPQGDAIAVALGSCLRVFDCRCASLFCAALFLHSWAPCPPKWYAVLCAVALVLSSTNVTYHVSNEASSVVERQDAGRGGCHGAHRSSEGPKV